MLKCILVFINRIIVTDDTIYNDFVKNTTGIQEAIMGYVKGLNDIYENSILKDAPNEKIYFRIGKWVKLKNFAPGCENPTIVLQEFSTVKVLFYNVLPK